MDFPHFSGSLPVQRQGVVRYTVQIDYYYYYYYIDPNSAGFF